MEFPAHIVFSCLLVCQPAIFVDSKRDGTGAAHGRKGFRMKRAELDRRIANGETLDEDALDAVCDRIAPRYGVELAGSRYAA